jgi:GTPase SAR1 family protein
MEDSSNLPSRDLVKSLEAMPYEILQSKSLSYQDFLFKLIIIGDSAVGKSCILHRLTTNEFMEDHEVTVGVEFGTLLVKLQQQVFKLQIWDTAG